MQVSCHAHTLPVYKEGRCVQGRFSFFMTSAGEEATAIGSAAALSLDDTVMPLHSLTVPRSVAIHLVEGPWYSDCDDVSMQNWVLSCITGLHCSCLCNAARLHPALSAVPLHWPGLCLTTKVFAAWSAIWLKHMLCICASQRNFRLTRTCICTSHALVY